MKLETKRRLLLAPYATVPVDRHGVSAIVLFADIFSLRDISSIIIRIVIRPTRVVFALTKTPSNEYMQQPNLLLKYYP